jgi:hypothetical protein
MEASTRSSFGRTNSKGNGSLRVGGEERTMTTSQRIHNAVVSATRFFSRMFFATIPPICLLDRLHSF